MPRAGQVSRTQSSSWTRGVIPEVEPGTEKSSVTSEKPLPATPKVEGASSSDVKKKDTPQGLKENPAPAATAKDTLPVAEPEPVKEKTDNSQ